MHLTLSTLLMTLSVDYVVPDSYHPILPEFSVSGDECTAQYWIKQAQEAIKARKQYVKPSNKKARNIVFFLGDGMSIPTLAAARILLGQRDNKTGEEAQLSFEKFPTTGLVKTYCVNQQIPDSACTATAYLCGVKTNYGVIGVTATVPRQDCTASLEPSARLESIAAWALADGRDAGLVTTTRVTHASPSGLYARTADREWESDADIAEYFLNHHKHIPKCHDIAKQLVHTQPGKDFKVILGGGRREFIPCSNFDEEGCRGKRIDGKNLIKDWKEDKKSRNASHQYVWNLDQLKKAAAAQPEYLLGLFESSHLQYHMEANHTNKPTLTQLTEVAIKSLRRNKKGFFLFVEGGHIDMAHHKNKVQIALDEAIELSKAVKRATELLPENDTLVVVTADHAHGMTLNGYTHRGSDILGTSDEKDNDSVPYMTLSYANGPGFRPQENGKRVDVTQDKNYHKLSWRTHVDVPLVKEAHGGDDVAVFAWGVQHDMMSGLYEQSQVPHRIAYAGCIGPSKDLCDIKTP